MEFNCKHYRKGCVVRAPCCNEIFGCHRCHNESTTAEHEDLLPQDVKKVICLICNFEQPVAQACTNCRVMMGNYFCKICQVYDDDVEKGIFHCDDCGLCRIGGKKNYLHCKKCGDCRPAKFYHPCLEGSSRQSCPICYENIFDSYEERYIMKCGHNIHWKCFNKMVLYGRYSCPICSKSVNDMSRHWKILDLMIQASQPRYRSKVWILCNDCNCTSEVFYHFLGQRCGSCYSYNTYRIAPPPVPRQ